MIEVEAVKTESQRDQIERHLMEKDSLYSDIWKFGLNTALRISDLLAITTEQVDSIDPDKRELAMTEMKTKKKRTIRLNAPAMEVITRRRTQFPTDIWLFQSRSPKNSKREAPKAITRKSVSRVFLAVGEKVAPSVHLGTHSMRKTRGFAMFDAGVSIEQICKVLNHSSPAITMRYIGIDKEAVLKSYDDFEL